LSGDERTGIEDVLLGPLRPPNDPEFLEDEKRRKREMNQKKLQNQRTYAASALAKYQRDDDGMTVEEGGISERDYESEVKLDGLSGVIVNEAEAVTEEEEGLVVQSE
jgi:hypothetical protein